MDHENEFESLPVNEGIEIVIEYLKATKAGNIKKINKLFNEHPDLFQPETLHMAKTMIRQIAETTNNPFLLKLVNSDTH